MRHLFGLILLFVLSTTPALARMFRWVDSNGGVHYGDTIPSQLSSQAASEFNRRGILIKKPTPAAPTPEQLKAREVSREQAKRQARRDRALLATYANEQEIDQTRDRRLRQIRQQIRTLTAEQATTQKRLTRDQQRATVAKKMNGRIPASLAQQIKDTTAELMQVQNTITRKRQEMKKTRAHFEASKLRFRRLTRRQ